MSNTQLISIIGAGHSGSTLLDLVLGGHSSIHSVGEIALWDQYIREDKECSCGSPPASCELWSEIVERWQLYLTSSPTNVGSTDTRSKTVEGISNRARYRLCLLLTVLFPMYKRPNALEGILPEFKKRTTNVFELYKIIREVSGKPVICDSSKSAYRFRLMHARQPESCKAIFLTRDGRAVAASHYRRYGKPIADSARRWRFANGYTQSMLRTLPEQSYIHVRYEELCRESEETLKRICEFTGFQYSEEMLNFTGTTQHNIGGNRMRMSGLYEIHEDLKWREILTKEQVDIFEKIAGKTNDELLGKYATL